MLASGGLYSVQIQIHKRYCHMCWIRELTGQISGFASAFARHSSQRLKVSSQFLFWMFSYNNKFVLPVFQIKSAVPLTDVQLWTVSCCSCKMVNSTQTACRYYDCSHLSAASLIFSEACFLYSECILRRNRGDICIYGCTG